MSQVAVPAPVRDRIPRKMKEAISAWRSTNTKQCDDVDAWMSLTRNARSRVVALALEARVGSLPPSLNALQLAGNCSCSEM